MKIYISHRDIAGVFVPLLLLILSGCSQAAPPQEPTETRTILPGTPSPSGALTASPAAITSTIPPEHTPVSLITSTAAPTAARKATPTETLIPLDKLTIPTPFDSMSRPVDGMVMVYVPAGEFLMGSSQAQLETAYALCDQEVVNGTCPPGRFDDEMPQHRVSLDSFWIDQTEVTVGQYQACIDAGACDPWDCYNPEAEIGLPEHPVGCIRWVGAVKYCQWVGARLPTEAEWEYAARGPESYIYPWGNLFDVRRLNYCDLNCYNRWRDSSYDDGYNSVAPVGTFLSGTSWCGAFDMAGNAAELVADWYEPDYYASSPVHNPTGPESGTLVLFKGGACNHRASYLRSAWRATIPPDSYYGLVGFRCAKDG